jgi:hypothetical protein
MPNVLEKQDDRTLDGFSALFISSQRTLFDQAHLTMLSEDLLYA